MTDDFYLEDARKGAVFSDDREYRYRLWRLWDNKKPAVAFIMLNPSTADESTDDQTIRRCLGYAQDWGFGELIVGNLFAIRATDPAEMKAHPDPIGPENGAALIDIAMDASMTVAAWGSHGEYMDRGRTVTEHLRETGHVLHAIDTTKDGHPVHPLYKPANMEPEPFEYGDST